LHIYYFEKLEVWQAAKKLAIQVYKITDVFPATERFILADQVKRCALSIPANIAEGSTRQSVKDYSRFINIAYGSAIELLNHMLIAAELKYINDTVLEAIRKDITQITNQLRALDKAILLKLQEPKTNNKTT
jgi:four helix bundle protein